MTDIKPGDVLCAQTHIVRQDCKGHVNVGDKVTVTRVYQIPSGGVIVDVRNDYGDALVDIVCLPPIERVFRKEARYDARP